jgi:hypothetical protein
MKKNTTAAMHTKTKTTVNNTAAKNAVKNTQQEVKKTSNKKSAIPVVKDIDEGSAERK